MFQAVGCNYVHLFKVKQTETTITYISLSSHTIALMLETVKSSCGLSNVTKKILEN